MVMHVLRPGEVMRKVDLHDMTDNDVKRSLCFSFYLHDSTSTGTRM